MKLSELLAGVNLSVDIADIDIADVSCDSRNVPKNSIFICIKGEKFDGHDHAEKVCENGAKIVICDHDVGLKNQIIVEDTRAAYAIICANFFGNPSKKMTMIGVTGTNGKTTIVTTIKDALTKCSKKIGLIGTIQNEIGDRIVKTSRTTPDAYELQKLLSEMQKENCDYVVMEVSSHALVQQRVGAIRYDTAVFTNLSQDHLDYHSDMEDYFSAKKKLFSVCDIGIVNIDDEHGKRIEKDADCKILSYSSHQEGADFFAADVILQPTGVEFTLNHGNVKTGIKFPMPGEYSVQNVLAVIATCVQSGIEIDQVTKAINSSVGVKGRSEVIPLDRDYTVICDYAHSPDGLQNILPSVRKYTKGRLITLFGCGGDRDKLKRPIMGEIAAENSDMLIVTSDNPRTEKPMDIIADIMVGVNRHNTKYVVIEDRREAIRYALKNARANDVIILAGKGHEDYQEIHGEKFDFDERAIVKAINDELISQGL